ncbi:MAG: purine-nucleoside phosphorylase [Chlorobi bacterium NICIL-2]|jgi:purine-nucleoside phosphorylase|nr:MAG: purine-nucleoside phosphorylase [Chlorobi bacterium NICIL-2]GBD05991.1 Purine nucleoside phosphorylase 1 [bacterium HR20]GIV56908.1 MAG: purine nucleoside phosphorylase [Candidatus Kapabacteria bacterium]
MNNLRQMLEESIAYLRQQTQWEPHVAVVLGSGLQRLADACEHEHAIPYHEIPHMPRSTAPSHRGLLLFGTWSGVPVVIMQGRVHYYEGYSMQQVTYGVRLLRALGVQTLVLTNAAGALNPLFRRGDVMLIADHINLMGDSPLIGPNDDTLGPRFPDMSDPYSERLRAIARTVALENRILLREGVLVAVHGPNLETKAEYRFLRAIGADAVGMSTVPETIAAVHSGMQVLAFSILTDECFPDALRAVTAEEIIAAAEEAAPKLERIVSGVLPHLR